MKNILIAKDLQPMVMSAVTFLQRSDIAVHPVVSGDEILQFHLAQPAHLIMTRPGLPGIACETLFNIIRRGETMKNVSLLLLCDDTTLHREIARRCRANAVVTRPVNTSVLAEKVHQLLDVPPRRSYRVILNITVEGKHNGKPVMCNSVNVSSAGMLIRTKEVLAPGDQIECSFYLPDGRRVGARGDIVRSLRPDSAADDLLYGIRFQSFAPGSEAAIAAFVEREQVRQQSAAPDAPPTALAG